MSEARELLERARAREAAREAAYRPIDYARMNRESPKLKAALTRAEKKGERRSPEQREAVLLACAKAVRVWDEIGAWPDNWSNWQRALDDCFPVFCAPRLEDLR
jgi:hypothetical protein